MGWAIMAGVFDMYGNLSVILPHSIAKNNLDFFSFLIDSLATERIMKEGRINLRLNGFNAILF